MIGFKGFKGLGCGLGRDAADLAARFHLGGELAREIVLEVVLLVLIRVRVRVGVRRSG